MRSCNSCQQNNANPQSNPRILLLQRHEPVQNVACAGPKADFKEVFVGKIKEEITVSLYNDLSKALKKDEELKTRYQTIFDELLAAATAPVEGEEVAEEGS